MKRTSSVLAVLLLACGSGLAPVRADVPTAEGVCVVYPFEAGPEVGMLEAEAVTQRFVDVLRSSLRFDVLSGYALEVRLAEVGMRIESIPKANADEAVRAARALRAPRIVVGRVVRDGRRCTLETTLCDAGSGTIVRTARTTREGTFEAFVHEIPPRNIHALFRLEYEPGAEPAVGKASVGGQPPRTVALSPSAREPTADWETAVNRAQERVAGHLELGTRLTVFKLLQTHKRTFVGDVDRLAENEDYAPLKPFADWMFSPACGTELAWERLSVAARRGDIGREGDIVLRGPILGVIGRRANDTRATPYGAFGLALFAAEAEPETWWEQGYDSPSQWEALGRPTAPHGGVHRELDVRNAVGLQLAAGCDFKICDTLSVDASLRVLYVSVRGRSSVTESDGVTADGGLATIPLTSIAAALGFRYAF